MTFNGVRPIGDCLGSILEAGGDPSGILVFDNGSTDGTADRVRREFPGILVLDSATNLGYGAAANLATQLARTEYVAIVNQDVVVTSGWLDRLVAALDADPTAGLATPKILLRSDRSRINACGNAPHYTGVTPCRGYNRPAEALTTPEEVGAVSGAAFVIRRRLFDALGGFDPVFFLYLEDTDLSLRAVLEGYHCRYVPESVVLHEFEPRFGPEKLFWLERNRAIMVLKLYRWRTLLVLAPALVLAEVAVWGYSLLRGPAGLGAKARAYAWLARNRRAILRARDKAQIRRRVPDRTLLARCTPDLELDELGPGLGRWAATMINPCFRFWYRVVERTVRW